MSACLVDPYSWDEIATGKPDTITEYTPGASIVLHTEAAEPVHYKFSKSVTYVTQDGKVIESSKAPQRGSKK